MNEDFLNLFDKYSIQEIEEGQLYTLVKGKVVVYLSHFTHEYDMADDDDSQAIVTVFKDHLNVLTIGGNLEYILNEVRKVI